MTPTNQHSERWQVAMQALPLVAILRGVKPDEVVAVGKVLYDCGYRILEVPLNSPEPFDSIAALRQAMPDDVVVGAGTVLTADQVDACAQTQCELIVAPNFSVAVAERVAFHGMLYCPGIATPSEAFSALDAGAHALKLFPAEVIGPAGLKAMLAVLPEGTVTLPVGGIEPGNMQDYLVAGASGFGIGSSLYKPGVDLLQLELQGQRLAEQLKRAQKG